MMDCRDASACQGVGSLCFFPYLNPLVSWHALVLGHLLYLFVVFVMRSIMRGRRALNMSRVLVVYNVLQICLSAAMAINLSPPLKNGVFNLSGKFCPDIEFWMFVHYCSKYIDMLDTVFILCKKKEDQLSFLHVYHHCTIGLIWGILLRNGLANGTAFFGTWINSFVHFLMYSHYLWTSLGYRNPFKFLLTKIQMLQFSLCILHAILVTLLDTQFTLGWNMLQLLYNASLLVLFINFYMNSRGKGCAIEKKPQ